MNTYYAKLVYDANGGSGAPSSVSKNARSNGEPVATIDFTVSNRKPTRTGYDFLGWARTTTATTVLYTGTGNETHSIMTASTNSADPITHTLYAVW
jgi:hypothetical protein